MASSNPEGAISQPPAAIRSREGQLEPFDWYAEMRRDSPVRYDEQRRTWDLFRYEDVNQVLSNHDSFTADITQADIDIPRASSENDGSLMQTMLSADPPEHDRLRGFVNDRFQPGTIRQNRSRIEEITDEFLDQLEGRDEIDLVDDFAYPLPVTIIAELLGIPPERRDQFKAWSDALVARPEDETEVAIKRNRQQREQAQKEMSEYFGELIEERQTEDGSDLITLAATTEELSREEQIGFCILLLLAGNVTTTNLITNAIWSFDEQNITEAVRTGDIDRQSAIEEVLRYRSPVQALRRVAVDDVEIGGQQIQKGDIVTPWLGAANRDPDVFEAPDEFRPERSPNPHIAFGKGIHYCLGAPLARLEADIALGGLLDRFGIIDPDLTNLQPLPTLYGLKLLTCRIDTGSYSS